jgi:hypothetical protein
VEELEELLMVVCGDGMMTGGRSFLKIKIKRSAETSSLALEMNQDWTPWDRIASEHLNIQQSSPSWYRFFFGLV